MLSYHDLADLPVFVYGTLQRGEEREPLWPCKPLRIAAATTRGHLYDLGPYPALTAGTDVVLGELWYVPLENLPEVLRTLDAIEGFRGAPDDLYRRETIPCQPLFELDPELPSESAASPSTESELAHSAAEPAIAAYSYLFTQTGRLNRGLRVRANAAGYCCWHRARKECGGWAADRNR